MPNSALTKVTRTSQRSNLALFGILPLALVLVSLLIWGVQRISGQEQQKLQMDFKIVTRYVAQHEKFLATLDRQNRLLKPLDIVPLTGQHTPAPAERPNAMFYEGQHALAAMPFSLMCGQQARCPIQGKEIVGIGGYLSDFYSKYWAASFFPAAAAFLIDPADDISLSVPAVNAESGYQPLTQAIFLNVTDTVRGQRRLTPSAGRLPLDPLKDTPPPVTWLRYAQASRYMIAAVLTSLPGQGGPQASIPVYAATLFDRDRISISQRVLDTQPYDRFWLSRNGQLLIGEAEPPAVSKAGLHYTRHGIVVKLEDQSGQWAGHYQIDYATYFRGNFWLLASVLIILLLSTSGAWLYARWYKRRVILPAQAAQQEIIESEAFNRSVLDTAPVALCALRQEDGEVMFGNGLCSRWLGLAAGQPWPAALQSTALRQRLLGATGPDTIEAFKTADGRYLFMAFTPTRYHKQEAILCAFADISNRIAMEEALSQARQQADRANEAKSHFLATMSHEIRTPLYGVLGTLDVLGMTKLDSAQRTHVERIQDSSVILQKLISDILDISKIEAGQLELASTFFNPRQLIQRCVGAYSALARKKALVLYSCIDTTIPERVEGDETRLMQILSNLIGNAVKFTDSGHVIVRVSTEDTEGDQVTLMIQVTDSGIGIEAEHQSRLFDQFYQVRDARHETPGTGLGLSICANLAQLMGGKIEVSSEKGLGSSFLLSLPLRQAPPDHAQRPSLGNTPVYVRCPRKDLRDNLCAWLNHWGANARPAHESQPPLGQQDVLLDVVLGDAYPPGTAPLHIVADDADGSPQDGLVHVSRYSVDDIGFAIERLARKQDAAPARASTAHPEPAGIALRVLVAEDNPINQVTLRDQLEQLGCSVTLAQDGAEALAAWSIGAYDLLLTDVNMPRLNGYELTVALRSQGVNVPIIGVTANGMRDEGTRCMHSGMTHWLVKPIELDTLRSLLAKFAAAGASPAPGARGPGDAMTFDLADFPARHKALFLETGRRDLEQFEQALRDEQPDKLIALTHRIRGALAVIKQGGLTDMARKLEAALRRDGLDHASSGKAADFAQAFSRLLEQINDEA
ncbi:ATP-binding protein [Pusillimonas sp. SM2304]|uniref:hybrid sensor histidine kinase/response regulator n=1 Tax=Pusillimonas sp. SM2304 TaxID=3073241 RepID=UPI002876F451|nr:ATP-binding protein [Pusillimonas sp. SM2304]MDS1142214.1 ATP-binding protein [Pusillimonas sp. SM2304]